MNVDQLTLALNLIPLELWNTLYMVFCASVLATLFGLPLGIILTITDKGHLKENRWLHEGLGTIVNVGRSFPFAILMVALIPFTRWIIGTSLGTTASVIPLSIAAIPFLARLVEASLKEVDKGMIEAAVVMGSTPWQIITKVLLPEALPSLLLGLTTTVINLIGYSAMAGTMGGGGLGKIAIQYGYQRFNTFLMVVTVILLILIVQAIQGAGHFIVKKINIKRGKGLSK
ncbi:methionine ABC transporter permease [Candidatus Protochlamydia phocaeensis]|uniref:methionine ABC transporter permease n=1 Tax=Candidatus Protochlamydia phocaeensis TaxID=1414722 RepID=UPI0008394884|nr:methionine ABC transporter permease [Candidatus Protochlamydia phocaeensis]